MKYKTESKFTREMMRSKNEIPSIIKQNVIRLVALMTIEDMKKIFNIEIIDPNSIESWSIINDPDASDAKKNEIEELKQQDIFKIKVSYER